MTMTEDTKTSLVVGDPAAPPVDQPGGLDTVHTLQIATQETSEQMEQLIATAATENRDLTEDEAGLLAKLKERHDVASAQLDTLTDIHNRSLANADAFAALKLRPAAPTFGDRQRVAYGDGVSHEPDMYRHVLERGSGDPDFLRDVLMEAGGVGTGDPSAGNAVERLRRHQVFEHQRDNTSTNFPGFVVPRYLGAAAVNEVATFGRPVATAIGSMPLPMNKEIRLPVETTVPTADIQSAENAAVSETDQVTTEATISVKTIAGSQQLSFQAVDLGNGADVFFMRSLARQVATGVDKEILGAASGGLNIAATVTSAHRLDEDVANATAADTYGKIMKAAQVLNQARSRGPDILIMHPRRYWHTLAGLDTTKRPLFQAMTSTALNVIATGDTPTQYGATGVDIQGMRLITSGHVSTTTDTDHDVIIALNVDDYALFESQTMTVKGYANGVGGSAASTGINTLTHTLVMYQYIANKLVNDQGAVHLHGTVTATTL